MSDRKPTLLVTGASGHMGQRVLELLLEGGAGSIIAVTRTPEKIAAFAPRGVDIRQGDFDHADALVRAFTGADRVLIISTDALGVPGLRLQQHLTAVKAAEAAGVRHVVYTSLTNPGSDSPILLAPDHHGTEDALAASQLGWIVLRNNVYTDFQLGALGRAIAMGGLYNASGSGKIGYVTREDCSRAAAAALTAAFDGRRTLDITGPEALSQDDLAKIASEVSGKPVTYVPLEVEVLIQNMVGAGLPRPVADVYASFDAAAAQGKLDVVSSAVEDLTGKKPIRFADFVAANRAELLQAAGIN